MRTTLLLPALALACLAACSNKVDRFTLDRVVPRGLSQADVRRACALGESMRHVATAVPSADNPPDRALIITDVTAALCDEAVAWEQDARAWRATRNFDALPPDRRAAEIRDARIAAERAHADAASRFWQTFEDADRHWGPIGADTCPRIAPRDELAYLLGLVGGTLGLLHDRASGGQVGVPLDTLGRVARGAACLDDARWWHAPGALQAASWATIPGSGPEGVDPWALLESQAAAGDASGVRVARALSVLIYANGDRTGDVERGIKAHAASLESTPMDPEYALLDEYARLVTLHQSDRLWIEAEGYRTPTFGELPSDESAPPPALQEDPFGADPFGDDPFATPPAPAPDPQEPQ